MSLNGFILFRDATKNNNNKNEKKETNVDG